MYEMLDMKQENDLFPNQIENIKSTEQIIGLFFLWMAFVAYYLMGDTGLFIVGSLYLIGFVLMLLTIVRRNSKE